MKRLDIFLIAILLLAGGCGGGSGGSGSGRTDPPTQSPAPPPPVVANNAPISRLWDPPLRAVVGSQMNYDFTRGGTIVRDPDGDPLIYIVSWSSWDSRQGPRVWNGLTLSDTHLTGVPERDGSNELLVEARDNRGGTATYRILIEAATNGAPVLQTKHSSRVLAQGQAVDIDVTQGGQTFRDPENDALTYTVALSPLPRGLTVQGTRVTGALTEPGAVRVFVRAVDAFGAERSDEFVLAVPHAIEARPVLPTASFIYDDFQLDLPQMALFSREHFAPFWDTTPDHNPTSNAGATLGRVLFYDKRLSITNTHSCASCHEQARGFGIGTRLGQGVTGDFTLRHPMALTNVRYNLDNRFFSDGRATTLETLALMPIEDARELGNSIDLLIPKLAATDFYPPLFEAAFGSTAITSERISLALAQFLRALISFDAKIDRADRIPEDGSPPTIQLTEQELLGRDMFARGNCGHCHVQGAHQNDREANNGLDEVPTDPGMGNGVFRTASLRNIAVSGPYMHDGRFATLREVIDHYDSGVQGSPLLDFLLTDFTASGNRPRRLNMTEAEKTALEAFLNTLTDEQFLSAEKFSDPFQ